MLTKTPRRADNAADLPRAGTPCRLPSSRKRPSVSSALSSNASRSARSSSNAVVCEVGEAIKKVESCNSHLQIESLDLTPEVVESRTSEDRHWQADRDQHQDLAQTSRAIATFRRRVKGKCLTQAPNRTKGSQERRDTGDGVEASSAAGQFEMDNRGGTVRCAPGAIDCEGIQMMGHASS
jgi:hypothetical protein